MAASLRAAALHARRPLTAPTPFSSLSSSSLPSWRMGVLRAYSSSGSGSGGSSKPGEMDVDAALRSPAALPAPGEGEPVTLDVSGDGATVRLDRMGPLVVNHDGSVGRLNNWAEMTRAEQKNTLRILGRRNRQRLDELQKRRQREQGQGQGQAAGQDSGPGSSSS